MKMKLKKIIFSVILLFLSVMIYSQNFNVPDFSNDKIGTYMPILFINEFNRTNNYREAMIINQNRYYDVVCINKNIVYSNLNFHDQFAIKPDDVKLFTFNENNGIIKLIDRNGYKYIKISDDLNYYNVYRIYINNHIFNILNKFHQNIIVKTDDGLLYNGKRWIINLDIQNYPKDDNFMYFYEQQNGEYIGIQYIRNEIRFYSLEPDDNNYLASKNKELLFILK
jgi:hypothetical protein